MFVKTVLTSVLSYILNLFMLWLLDMSGTAFDFTLLEWGCKPYPQGEIRSPLIFPVSQGNLSLLHPGSCSSCDASEPLVRISRLWLWPPSPAFGTLGTCHKQRTGSQYCHIVTYCHILLHIVIYCHCCILPHIVAYCKIFVFYAFPYKRVRDATGFDTLKKCYNL